VMMSVAFKLITVYSSLVTDHGLYCRWTPLHDGPIG